MYTRNYSTSIIKLLSLVHKVFAVKLLKAHNIHLSVVNLLKVNDDCDYRFGNHV